MAAAPGTELPAWLAPAPALTDAAARPRTLLFAFCNDYKQCLLSALHAAGEEQGCFHAAKYFTPRSEPEPPAQMRCCGFPGAGTLCLHPALCPAHGVPPCTPNHHSRTEQREQQRQQQPRPCQHRPRDAPDSLATACTNVRAVPQGWGAGCPRPVPCRAGLSLTGHLHLGLALQQGSHPVADDAAVEAGVRAVQ